MPKKKQWIHISKWNGLPATQVQSVGFSPGGTLWVGFQCGGIASAEPRTLYRTWKSVQTKWYFNDNQTLRSPPAANGPGLPCNLINTIYPLDNKRIVCGTVQGLGITLDGNRWSFRRGADYPDKIKGLYDSPPNGWTPPSNTEIATLLPEDYITAFESTPDGLWIGFRQKGAVLTDPNNDFIKKADYPFNVKKTSGTWVTDFLSIENGTMLVSTYGEGLNAVPGNGYIKQSSPMSKEIPFPENTSLLTEKEIQTLKTQLKNLDPLPKEKPWAVALYEDWTTRGNWCERYGQRKVMMCAVHMPVTQRTFGFDQKYQIWGDIGKHRLNNDRLRHWIHWVNKPSDTNILFEPSCHIRQEAEWDDHAEEYKRTWDGPDVWAYTAIQKCKHLISLYFYNPNAQETRAGHRDYLIEVRNQSSNDVAGPILASSRVREFGGSGVYKNFAVNGPGTYAFRICKNESFNTLINGIFISQLHEQTQNQNREKSFFSAYCDKLPHPPPLTPESVSTIPPDALNAWQLTVEADNSEKGLLLSHDLKLEAFRIALSENADSALLANWRWHTRLWNQDDIYNFNESMRICWETQQQKFVSYRSADWYPNSPNTIPFTSEEIRIMDSEKIDWKQYLPGQTPKIPVNELKEKLKIWESQNKNIYKM